MAARPERTDPFEAARRVIRTREVIERLQDHVLGHVELNASQVSAAVALLRKSLPDLGPPGGEGELAQSLEQWLDSLPRPNGR